MFLEVEGYKDNNTIASGDDIFLLEKILKKHPDKVLYLKSPQAVVKTHAQSSFSELINQRKRWAAKTNAYQNPFSKFVGLLVITTNMLLLSLLLLMLFESISINLWFIFSVVKISVDFLLIYKSAVFFMQTKALKSYPLAALVYPLFACWIACSSVLTTYTWKDRSFAK